MSPRIKKLVGTILTLLWLPLYALMAMAVAVRVLPHGTPVVAFLYYALAGTLWAIPVGLLFPWMYSEPNRSRDTT